MKYLVVKIKPEIEKKLPPELKTEEDKFNFFMNLKGEYFRKQKGRETLLAVITTGEIQAVCTKPKDMDPCVCKNGSCGKLDSHECADPESIGHHYFIKKHLGIGIKEALKNFLMLKQPIYGAKNEWLALNRLTDHHLAVPKPVAFGEKGYNPLFQSSFIVMQSIENSSSLEDVCRDWKKEPPNLVFKRALIKEVAKISREMHALGINHRDYYICHFLLKKNSMLEQPILNLIDLHRAQIRKTVPFRWLCKDLAGLYFSSMDIGLTKRDRFRFLKEYFLLSLRDSLICHDTLLRCAYKKAVKLYKKECKK